MRACVYHAQIMIQMHMLEGRIMTWMYRLQQRLAITRYEGLAILILAGMLFLGLVAKQRQAPKVKPDPETHAKVEARFKAHSVALPGANRPAAGPKRPSTAAEPAKADANTRINLNTASAPTLEQLPGIGPTLSRRIVEHRRTHGPFATVDDITRVHGIGEKTVARLKPLLVIDSGS